MTTILKQFGGSAMKSNKYSKKLTIKFIKKLFIISVIYTVSFFTLYYLLYRLAQYTTWYPNDETYLLLTSIAYNQTIMFFLYLIGIVIIFIYLLMKSLSYIDQIIDQSSLLIEENDEGSISPSRFKRN